MTIALSRPQFWDVGSQTCKDEPQDSKEGCHACCACLYSVGTISVSRFYCGFQGFKHLRQGQTLDFREDSPSPPFNVSLASKQLGCPDPSLTSSPHLFSWTSPLPLFLAPLPTRLRRLLLPLTVSPRLSPACENLVSRLMF